MYQNPPRYVPGPAPVETMPQRRPRRLVPLLVVSVALFFGGSYLVSPEPAIRVLPGIAFAEVDGRHVVLVPYERYGGRGMFQLLAEDLAQVRLAAADAATGEVLWDTQLADRATHPASVLAAGHRYAYLTTGSGVAVVGLADGTVAADVQATAHAYDPASRRILTLNATGDVLAIGLDQTAAGPVDAPTAAAWTERLAAAPAGGPAATAAEAAVGPGSPERITLRDLPFGIPGRELVRITANGRRLPVGGIALAGARLVVDGGTAVGATGDVLVEHRRSANDTGIALSLVSVDNGQVAGSLEVESPVERAVTGPNGTAAVATRTALAVVRGDGQIIRVDVGSTDFFGTPS